MTKDMIDGAETLMKRVTELVNRMTYNELTDRGGILEILRSEYFKMVDQWSDEVLEQARSVNNESAFDLMESIKKNADEINRAYKAVTS